MPELVITEQQKRQQLFDTMIIKSEAVRALDHILLKIKK